MKGPWNAEEDALLVYLISQGFQNWGKLAQQMNGRTAKQCRERWRHHLDPQVSKEEFSAEEDKIVFEKQLEFGNSWAQISQCLPGRTEDSVKIRFKALARESQSGRATRTRGRCLRNALSVFSPGLFPDLLSAHTAAAEEEESHPAAAEPALP